MRHLIRSLAALTFVVVTGEAGAQSCQSIGGNLVANCSFETPGVSASQYQFLPTLSGWNVTGGQFERWSNGFNGFTSKDGVSHLELDSDVGNTTIWQKLATVAGQTYTVTFSAAHRSLVQNNVAQHSQLAFLTGADASSLNQIFTTTQLTDNSPGQYKWVDYSTSFVAQGGTTVIAFRGIGPSNTYGDHLDNIAVVSTVPEPSTYALMGAGLLGLFGAARRRRQQA